MADTQEQLRAKNAWECAKAADAAYANLAKSLPALIMTSGLMQVIAFINQKSVENAPNEYHLLGGHLRTWLSQQFKTKLPNPNFRDFMESLLKADALTYQQVTAEAHAWLRWVRQMAAAAQVGRGPQ